MLYVVFGIMTFVCVFIFPVALASMIRKIIHEKSVILECVLLVICGLSAYLWFLIVFSEL